MKPLEHLTIVLERPLNAGNVGSVARVMKNTGLSNLILVNPKPYLNEEGFKMAMGSIELLKKAKVVSTLKEALEGFQMVIGTTRRRGRIRKSLLNPREVGEKVLPALQKNKVAIVFGCEKDGLSNDSLFLCHWISSIPASPKQPSFNLAQAVMVYAYEIFMNHWENKHGKQVAPIVDQQARESMFELMDNTLTRIGFYEHGSPKNLMRSLRQLFGKADLNKRDVRILKGIFSQMTRVIEKGNPGDLP